MNSSYKIYLLKKLLLYFIIFLQLLNLYTTLKFTAYKYQNNKIQYGFITNFNKLLTNK